MKKLLLLVLAAITFGATAQTTHFKNVNIFDGESDKLLMNQEVLVEGNMIKEIGTGLTAPADATVIDGGGKTLMPGLIDSHLHLSIYTPFSEGRQKYDPFQSALVAGVRCEKLLMRGYTTVRDLGGYSKYLTEAIEKGLIVGPRVFGAGRMISQTGGHGDMRGWNDPHPNIEGNGVTNYWERYHTTIADGPDEVLRAGRISLRNGAHFLKIFTSGGTSSEYDPLYMVQFTPEEIQAAVTAAAHYKTYVSTHVYTDEGVKIAVENGVQVMEHIPLISESTAKMLADKQIIGVMSNSVTLAPGQKEKLKANFTPDSYAKALITIQGAENALKAVIKHKTKVAFGSDLVSTLDLTIPYEADMQPKEFEVLDFYKMDPQQALAGFTSVGGELLEMTGPRNPWQEGPIGVIQVGAYADILLVDGNPFNDLKIMANDDNFKIIMKDGVIYKNEL